MTKVTAMVPGWCGKDAGDIEGELEGLAIAVLVTDGGAMVEVADNEGVAAGFVKHVGLCCVVLALSLVVSEGETDVVSEGRAVMVEGGLGVITSIEEEDMTTSDRKAFTNPLLPL